MFLSTNDGARRTNVGVGLPTSLTTDALSVSGTYLLAGLGGGGAWRRPLAEMVTSAGAGAGEAPRQFALAQNYPNPFNAGGACR